MGKFKAILGTALMVGNLIFLMKWMDGNKLILLKIFELIIILILINKFINKCCNELNQ